MWKQETKIPIAELKDIDTIFYRFNCGLCGSLNKLEFSEFYADFFTRRPESRWKDCLKCPICEGANYHDIQLYFENGFLYIDVQNERSSYMQTEVDQSSIEYSIDKENTSHNNIEIPLEFDFIESIIGNDFYGNYKNSISEIIALIQKPAVVEESIILKILYSNVISIFETYLFDLIVNAVNTDQEALINIVSKYQIFGKEKLEKSNIFEEYRNIKANVNEELKNIVFHNLKIVIPLFKHTLEIDFSDKISSLNEAVNIRHDIIHRNGKDFNNMYHTITIDDVVSIIKSTSEIVDFVNVQYELRRRHNIF